MQSIRSIPMTPVTKRWRWMQCLLLLASTFPTSSSSTDEGGELAFFATPLMTPNVSHRQYVCDRYDRFRNDKDVELRDGLSGMQLNVLVGAYEGAYFRYNETTGIDADYPGLVAVLLDELGRRGNFTWRDSFAIYKDPADFNATWPELMLWGIESYDVTADFWAQSLERMNAGAAFVKEWLDSSLILVSNQPDQSTTPINPWNWLRPYDLHVWLVTLLTILISGVVYQVLEWFADDRHDRSMWEWWQENAYLSMINFTQAYEYQPKALPGRIFGIRMAVWALLMTATYTANLASLLVDRSYTVAPELLEEIAVSDYKICTWEGTYSDIYLQENFASATRVPKPTLLEMYQGLQNGECEYLLDSVASWKKSQHMKDYNPTCDMYWVGGDRKIRQVGAGFITNADSGDRCTGFVRDVLNINMIDIIDSGFLEEAWGREHEQTQTIDCDTYQGSEEGQDDDDDGGSGPVRRLQPFQSIREQHAATDTNPQRRWLKAAGKAATGGAVAAAAASDQDDRRLTLEHMIGTFVFHWGLMSIALVLATTNSLYKKYRQKGEQDCQAGKEILQENREPTSCIFNDDNPQKELQELRQQMAGMQQHLLQFEKKMFEEQQCLGQQIQLLLEKIPSDTAHQGPALCPVTLAAGRHRDI